MTDTPGRRERKKAQTRRRIADAAAHLFATAGYDEVAMSDVARAADVSGQTIYNYFPAKHDLVLDMAETIRVRYESAVLDRPPDRSPAAALVEIARYDIERYRQTDRHEARGQFITVSVASPTVRRHALNARDHETRTVAAAIATTDPQLPAGVVHAHAAALISLFQLMTDRMGHGVIDDADMGAIADELASSVETAFDDLDRHFHALRAQYGPGPDPNTSGNATI